MGNLREETVETYDKSAKELAKYFAGIGARAEDIELGFRLAGNPSKARVVELGCGDGRDAKEIVERAGWYEGMDISEGLLHLARKYVPNASFVQADAVTYKFPENLDIIFAFASLLHLNKTETQSVLMRALKALNPGGIFFISLKYSPEYTEKIKEDRYGRRQFFFYNPELIEKLAGKEYETVFKDFQTMGHTEWFTIALKKL